MDQIRPLSHIGEDQDCFVLNSQCHLRRIQEVHE